MSETRTNVDLAELIAENFGANANYVEGLLNRFRSDPSLVDETWRAYFTDLLGEAAANGHPATVAQSSTAAQSNGEGATVAPATTVSDPQSAPGVSTPVQKQQPAAAAPATNGPAPSGAEVIPLRGGAARLVENMEASLEVPTATSQRRIPVKVLEENRLIINRHLQATNGGKASFTHLIAYALLRALEKFPQLNDGFAVMDGTPSRVRRPQINFGLAIDLAKKDGTRTLLVPNVKNAHRMRFAEFLKAYDDVVKRARDGKLQVADFQDTTISLTNPGTLGTVASTPRLMSGQSLIIATGAIEYPAEYQAMAPEALSQLGISRSFTVSSTYDHRIIQGAESGAFLALVHQLLLGEHNFYDAVFADLGISYKPMRWSVDHNPALLGGDHMRDQMIKQARVLELISAYRAHGHLIADTDPLHAVPIHYSAQLDIETYELTVWDLDREFNTDGLGGTERATLRQILELLQRFYCGTIGIEYRHIQSSEQKKW